MSKDMIKASIAIIPAYNEEGSVGLVVMGVRALGMDVVVVNDQSQDLTAAKARESGAEVLDLPLRLGAWGAIQAGFRYALKKGYDYGLTIDADGQHLPESIPFLVAGDSSIEHDVIIGSCPERVSSLRKMAWTWFRAISSTGFRDLTSGFRIYNRRAMRLLLDKKAYLFDYQDMGALLLMKKHGLRIKEVPVDMAPRQSGHSRVFSNWFRVCKYMLVTSFLSACKYKQKGRRSRHED